MKDDRTKLELIQNDESGLPFEVHDTDGCVAAFKMEGTRKLFVDAIWSKMLRLMLDGKA